jgi:hypothetical protein
MNGCASAQVQSEEPAQFDVSDPCVTPAGTVNALVYALGETGEPLAYTTATDIPVHPAASPPPTIRTSFGPWKTDFIGSTVAFRSLPPDARGQVWYRRGGERAGILGGDGFDLSESITTRIPPAFFDEVVARQESGSRGAIRSVLLPVDGQVQVDLAPLAALDVEAPTIEGQGTTRPTMHVLASAPAGADVLIGAVRASGANWLFITAPRETRVTFPELPAELAAFIPTGTPATLGAFVIDHSQFASWDEARVALGRSFLFAGGAEEAVEPGGYVAYASHVVGGNL